MSNSLTEGNIRGKVLSGKINFTFGATPVFSRIVVTSMIVLMCIFVRQCISVLCLI